MANKGAILERRLLNLIEISFIIHATEDSQKVCEKFAQLFSLDSKNFNCSTLKGHFGNPIFLFQMILFKKDSEKFVKILLGLINEVDRISVHEELQKLLDEHGNLRLYINKQMLVNGKIVIDGEDVIKIKIKPKGFTMEEKISKLREVLESHT